MDEEKKLRNETEKMLESLKKENLVSGAMREYEKGNYQQKASLVNSKAQIEGNFVVVHLRNEQYETIATYRVFNENKYKRIDD